MNCCGYNKTKGKIWGEGYYIEVIPINNTAGFYRVQILDADDNVLGETLSNGEDTPQYFLIAPGIQGKIKIIVDDTSVQYPPTDVYVNAIETVGAVGVLETATLFPLTATEGTSLEVTLVQSYTIPNGVIIIED